MAWITGVGMTRYGRLVGRTTLDLMSEAASLALADAGLERRDIDGLLCGYSTVMPHLMLATVFAEHFGLAPSYAHGVQSGGATDVSKPLHQLADSLSKRGMVILISDLLDDPALVVRGGLALAL